MDYAQTSGIAVLNAAPYSGGVFAKGSASHKRYVYQEASAETLEPVTRVESICARMAFRPVPRPCSSPCAIRVSPQRFAASASRNASRRLWSGPATPFRKRPGTSCMALPAESGDPEATRVYRPG